MRQVHLDGPRCSLKEIDALRRIGCGPERFLHMRLYASMFYRNWQMNLWRNVSPSLMSGKTLNQNVCRVFRFWLFPFNRTLLQVMSKAKAKKTSSTQLQSHIFPRVISVLLFSTRADFSSSLRSFIGKRKYNVAPIREDLTFNCSQWYRVSPGRDGAWGNVFHY